MTTMRFIGDVHAKFSQYETLLDGCDQSIQVGDFGIGFRREGPPPIERMGTAHRFIRGNHDCPSLCAELDQWIPDGTYEDGIFLTGGAWSIDYMYRTEGVNWWRDEELSYTEMKAVHEKYTCAKPKLMVTHDCPQGVLKELFGYNKIYPNSTGTFLQYLYEEHQPKLWIFGHHHQNVFKMVNGTYFICLGELEYIDVNLDEVKNDN